MLADIWPSAAEVAEKITSSIDKEQFEEEYARVWHGDDHWRSLPTPTGGVYDWDPASTYVQEPPYFENLDEQAVGGDIEAARILVKVGDSITTDHISPAGSIKPDSPAGRYLQDKGVTPPHFNSYGARRGNHQVMVRGTFANIRLRNELAPGTEGSFTTHLPSGDVMSVFDGAERYRDEAVPLGVLAGKEYGSGSSRDWAAKGPNLLGIRFVLAESFERIHRSNLVGMGVLPLEFKPGETSASHGLTGREVFAVRGVGAGITPGQDATIEVAREDGSTVSFPVTVRVDAAAEVEYFNAGGILRLVLRQMLARGR
jgi:aconitate hydratase